MQRNITKLQKPHRKVIANTRQVLSNASLRVETCFYSFLCKCLEIILIEIAVLHSPLLVIFSARVALCTEVKPNVKKL